MRQSIERQLGEQYADWRAVCNRLDGGIGPIGIGGVGVVGVVGWCRRLLLHQFDITLQRRLGLASDAAQHERTHDAFPELGLRHEQRAHALRWNQQRLHRAFRMTIDDQKLFDGMPKKEVSGAWLTSTVPTTLKPGWHRVQMRIFDWGYGAARVGLAIDRPAACRGNGASVCNGGRCLRRLWHLLQRK